LASTTSLAPASTKSCGWARPVKAGIRYDSNDDVRCRFGTMALSLGPLARRNGPNVYRPPKSRAIPDATSRRSAPGRCICMHGGRVPWLAIVCPPPCVVAGEGPARASSYVAHGSSRHARARSTSRAHGWAAAAREHVSIDSLPPPYRLAGPDSLTVEAVSTVGCGLVELGTCLHTNWNPQGLCVFAAHSMILPLLW
jgi:hypothetical protein